MERERVRIETSPKRVRTYLGGEVVADSTGVRLVWEKPHYPTYYFPKGHVLEGALKETGETRRSPSRGDATVYTVIAGGRQVEQAAYAYPESPVEALRDLVAFRWEEMDAWFEEDEEVFVHARDPYKRIDILPSSRHIEVRIDGVTVADSHRPHLLFETGLPVRYYLPKTDVRMDLLTPTEKVTHCPYKGAAEYWSVETPGGVHNDIVWSYRTPVAESLRIAGLVSFYNEKVDVYVDGECEERPVSPFS